MGTTQRTEVLIAGGGPVGLMTALELARGGVRVLLVNEQPSTALHPKANAISARSMEHFRRHGIAQILRPLALPDDYPTDVTYTTRLTGLELARLRMPCSRDAVAEAQRGEGPYDCAEPPHRCSQIYLEATLHDACVADPAIDIRFGHRLEEFQRTGDGIAATIRDLDSDQTYDVAALHLVGADGGRSTVRRALGIRYEGEAGVVRRMMGGAMMATLFEAKRDAGWLTINPSWQYWVVNADFRALVLSVDGRDRFVMLSRIPDDVDPDSIDDHDLINKAAGRPVEARILLRQPWTAGHALLAQSFGDDRVWLVGDAAHLFTPTGGLGMNTGVDDAANLAWKLAATIRGWGGAKLMASYEADRRPVGARNLSFSRGFADSIGTFEVSPDIEADTPEAAAERDRLGEHLANHGRSEFVIPGIALGIRYEDSPIVWPDGTPPVPDDPYDYVPTARPGHRAPHVWLGEGDALCDHFGAGFTLLRTDPAADAQAIANAAAARGVPLDILDAEQPRVRDRYQAKLVLIFPDGHIAWRGDAPPDDPLALIDKVRGAG